MKYGNYLMAGGLAACAAGAVILLPGEATRSADHIDPPSRTDPSVDSTPDRAADIADLYAWAEDGNLNIALTFAGPAATDQAATYDPDVLYRINLSTDGNPSNTESAIDVRFGLDGSNNAGVRVQGIPGSSTITGAVETTLTSNNASVRAGLYDDPFFFDLQGFRETLNTGDIRFDANRDFFANANVTAVVMQIPLANIPATGDLTLWSETRRFGGQL